MVNVVFTDHAIRDLNDIGEHIASDSERYAREVVQSLFESVHLLQSHPKAGRIVPEYRLTHLRELIEGSYRVVCRIADKFRIGTLAVHHAARLLKIPGIFQKNQYITVANKPATPILLRSFFIANKEVKFNTGSI
jgi:toxin ParE1/3/4